MNEPSIGGAEQREIAPDRNAPRPRTARPASGRHFFTVQHFLLGIIIALAAWLRFYDLSRTSLWSDEVGSWRQASLPFFEMLAATARDNYPPLHNIILHATIAIFGDSERALRIPSALLGVATIYALYRLGTLLWDRSTGLIAALLLTLSGFHVWFSTEVRMYALLAFTATAFVLTVFYAVGRPNLSTLAANAAVGTALLYTHVYGSFVFAGVNLVVLIALLTRAEGFAVSWRRWLATQCIPAVLFLPWVPFLLERGRHVVVHGFWIPQPTPEFVLLQFSQVVGGSLALIVLGAFALLSLINLEGIFGLGRPPPSKGPSWSRVEWQMGIVLAWLLVPVLAGYLISVAAQPIFLARYLICSLPSFLLLAARGLTLLTHSRIAFVVCLGLAIASSLSDLRYQAFERLRSDNRAAMREFSARYKSSDLVLYAPIKAAPVIAYYYRAPIPHLIGYKSIRSIKMEDVDADRFWLILRWPRQDYLDSLISEVGRQHRIIYSMTIPDQRLQLYLFARTPHSDANRPGF